MPEQRAELKQGMRILLLSHYFEPENGAPQRRWTALITRLVDAGHLVDVITPPPHYPSGHVSSSHAAVYRSGTSVRGKHGGMVHRVSYRKHGQTVVSRTIDHLWVAQASVRAALVLNRRGQIAPDVIVATAPGLPTLLAGRLLARKLRVPLVAEMRDAWPDLVSHTPGFTSGRGFAQAVKRRVHEAVTVLQREAAVIVTTTESFARVLRNRGMHDVRVIRNGTSLERYAIIPPTAHDHSALRVLYMGTIGRSQGLDSIVRAAALVKDRGVELDVRVIGFGADLARLRALNESLGAPVDLRGPVDARDVFEHYAWCDTTVVSLRAWEPFEWTVPSKLYELMATGKHVTAVVAGEAADLVREADCGDVLSPGDVEGIAALWERLAADRTLVDSRESSREWIARHADYDIVARRYEAVLRSALASEAADGA